MSRVPLFGSFFIASSTITDQQIMNELLLHEAGLGALPGGRGSAAAGPSTASSSSKSPTPGGGDMGRESSSSEREEERGGWAPAAQTIPENSEDESSDEEFTMKVCMYLGLFYLIIGACEITNLACMHGRQGLLWSVCVCEGVSVCLSIVLSSR